jgi:hypothetical protein
MDRVVALRLVERQVMAAAVGEQIYRGFQEMASRIDCIFASDAI